MKNEKIIFKVLVLILLAVMLVLPGCEKPRSAVEQKIASDADYEDNQAIRSGTSDELLLQQKLEKMMLDLRLKEAELEAKVKLLDEKLTEVREKQSQLEKIEARIQNLQTFTVIILIVGMIALVIGLMKIFKNRSPQKITAPPAARVEKTPEIKTTTAKTSSSPGKKS